MELQNTTLDDLAAVIGFRATLRLAAWFGARGNLYIPDKVEDGQLLVRLIGMSAAKKLTEEWGFQHIAVPMLKAYEVDVRNRMIAGMLELGASTAHIARDLRMSERRVQQICREMEVAGLIEIVTPKNTATSRPENYIEFPVRVEGQVAKKLQAFSARENAKGISPKNAEE